MNFAFGPSKVFLPPESGDMIEGLGKWKPIRESVLKGNLDLVAEKLSEVVEKEKVDSVLVEESLRNLSLLGIDLKRDELLT